LNGGSVDMITNGVLHLESEPADAQVIDYSPGLLPPHIALLVGSGIRPDVAKQRGYRSVTSKADLKALGFSDRQLRLPALVIPVYGVTGEIALCQARPDAPRIDKRGKVVKYETPAESKMAVDVPPMARNS